PNFLSALFIQQRINTLTGTDTHMMTALGADVQCAFQVFFIKYGFTRRAFHPDAFGHALAASIIFSIDPRRKYFFNPAHKLSLTPCSQFAAASMASRSA